MDSYIGQIRLFAGTFSPAGWAFCHGQSLPIIGNEALFALIGTTYGSTTTTFKLPNLTMAVAVGMSNSAPPGMGENYPIAKKGGSLQVTLTQAQLPSHTHSLNVSAANATTTMPTEKLLPATPPSPFTMYARPDNPEAMTTPPALSDKAVSFTGISLPHMNTMPTIVLNYIICVDGIFPDF